MQCVCKDLNVTNDHTTDLAVVYQKHVASWFRGARESPLRRRGARVEGKQFIRWSGRNQV